jgi:hypothetical protein
VTDAEYPVAVEATRQAADRARSEADAAESRSIVLLKEWLSPGQVIQFEQIGTINVTGSTGTRCRIRGGTIQNVDEFDDAGGIIRCWCFGPGADSGRWTGDVMLAQMLTLQNDEMGMRRVANLTQGPVPDWFYAESRRRNSLAPRNLFMQPDGLTYLNDGPL